MSQTIASDSGQLHSLRVHAADNVRVALKDLTASNQVIDNGQRITLTEAIRHKHDAPKATPSNTTARF